MNKTVVFACGGTGGHIYPALAIADELKQKDVDVHFVGTSNHIEAELIPKKGYPISFITISGFHRTFRLSNFLFPFKLLLALIQSRSILKRLKPDLVVGTGGYVCGPVLYMASKRSIPTMIQEQNSYPSVTTRLLQKHVDRIHIAYQQAKKFMNNAKEVVQTGNPVTLKETYEKSEARQMLNLKEEITVSIVGGSQGARSVNQAMAKALPALQKKYAVNVIWQTGKLTFNQYKDTDLNSAIIQPYFDNMDLVYSASDVIICRAGAMSLAEVALYKIPAIIIPLKTAAANHQYHNAMSFVEAGAASLVEDNNDLVDQVLNELNQLISDKIKREKMSEQMAKMAQTDARKVLAESALEMMKKN